ncbi:MAG: 16S rRNA (cytosine(967)-C(5))-methyltransferase, partial [Legionellales bacterium]|nr:16S rRNA (cytosine(967)-C(5))-methyltransferase [Legionellales bacterium]
YVTCSVLPIENQQQVERFLATHADAQVMALTHLPNQTIGCQLFPGQQQMDGFYYAKLVKVKS